MSRARVLTYSPDLTQLAVGCTDGQVKMWRVRSGEQMPLEGHWPGEDVVALAFSLDGFLLASASTDHTIKIWSLWGGMDGQEPTSIHTGHVACLSFSHDGTKLVVGHYHEETISIFDVKTGQVLHELRGFGDEPVRFAQFTQDEEHVVSTCASKMIRIWDVKSENCFRTLNTEGVIAVFPKTVGDDFVIQTANIGDQHSFALGTIRTWNSSKSNRSSCVLRFSSDGRKIACVDDFRGTLCL